MTEQTPEPFDVEVSLIIVDEEGHGGNGIATHWRRILAKIA